MAVIARQSVDKTGNVFCQKVAIGGIVSHQNLGDTVNLGARIGNRTAVFASDENGDVATDFLCGGNRIQRATLQFGIVVFGNNKNAHLDDPRLYDFCFVAQLVDKLCNVSNFDACLT